MTLKLSLATTCFAIWLCLSTSCLAAIVSGSITITFNSGPQAGNSYTGMFSYDDTGLTGVGDEDAAPTGAIQFDQGLTFTIIVDGITYTGQDDQDHPDFPVLEFLDGVPTTFDFVFQGAINERLEITPAGVVTLVAGTNPNSVGDYTLMLGTTPTGPEFKRGDCNADNSFNLADVIGKLGFLFSSQSVDCESACDSNDDGVINLADAVFTLATLFSGGASPEEPFATCGEDPTMDSLSCAAFAVCP